MANWEDVLISAKGFAVNAGRKMTNMADVMGLKMELAEKERDLRQVMEALGHLLYDSKKDGSELNDELVADLVKQSDILYKKIGKLQNAIDELYARKTCSCGAVNQEDAVYCNACGEKI
ncbi:MAG: zinc ribbon domain-containing protein [Ruminococcaceae bacterium]|nr:zinc ribbon domain-containing protein [Oscillospiraceae bacterium]